MAFGSSGILAIELGSNHLRIINGAVSGHRRERHGAERF